MLHTSAPSFASDVKCIQALKAANPNLKVGLIGAKVAVDADGSLKSAPCVDFVARNEFDFTIKDVADDKDWADIHGLSCRDAKGVIIHNADRPILENMDSLPFVIADLQARPEDRELFHRLPQASLYFDLYRARLQIALHLLPVAADRRAAIATAPAASAM